MFAHDERCRLLHLFDAQRPIQGVDVAGEPRWADFPPINSVLIGFARNAVAGVEVGGGVFGAQDADCGGERSVEGAMKICRGYRSS